MARALAALFVLAATAAHAAPATTFKIATLAPEGSSWMHAFQAWGKTLERDSGGRIRVKIYPGGVAGDERDVVRKMRLGQLDGAAVTSIGLGLIQGEVRALELPFMLRSYEELDYLRNRFSGELRKMFEDKGYVLLAWGDVGPVHIFSKNELRSEGDLVRAKMWAWVDDPLVRTLFREVGVNPVPLGVPDVLPSLQTGLIDACYGSPLATLALQWHTKVRFMTKLRISQAVGAVVVVKRAFDALSPELQHVLLADSKQFETRVLKLIRDDNDKALATMRATGLQVVDTPAELVKTFTEHAIAIRPKLEGSLYTHEWRAKVERALADFRSTHP